MQNLVDDFLYYLRHEKGQAEKTQKTYAAQLNWFVKWATKRGLTDWKAVTLSDLMAFVEDETKRPLKNAEEESTRKPSSETIYLEIAALRALYKFAENEKILPANIAENLSLPKRWKRLPKGLSTREVDALLKPEIPATTQTLCDQAIIELAYASGLRLAELRG
ncbi:MAG: xerD, partial [Spartobacteria bacterium]|nr:xerD [Spartobacteria bacterium]